MDDKKKEFSNIYDKHIDKIYRFIFFKVNSEDVAKDLCSEAFLKCWESFKDQDKKIENIQAFLYRIARNLVVDHYREKGRTEIVPTDCVLISDPGTSVFDKAAASSDFERVKSAISNINEDYQNIILLHYIEGLPMPEIAKMLDKTEDTARVTLHRALKALREELNRVDTA